MRVFGRKHTARLIAEEQRVPLLPGTGLLHGVDAALSSAAKIGYPVMLKSTAGGGGIGMRLCASPAELAEAFESVRRLSEASFGTGGVYLEKFVTRARHIEVQIFGDGDGNVIALGERDCSAQRRNQKVIEETPAPGITIETRARLFDSAIRMAKSVRYQSAGTVEFLLDSDSGAFYFLEVNTRLQVEHGVTEEVTGIDLVEWMVRQAAGDRDFPAAVESQGCAIQVRVYAEDPARNFQPSSGLLSQVEWPSDARVEAWVESDTEITPFYDPMLAKIIVRGDDRAAALSQLREALTKTRVAGIETNLAYLRQVCDDPEFATGGITTSFLGSFEYRRRAIEVIDPGTQTTIQDFPGRLGYWHIGVPPSGPMDSLAFRLANRLVGNADSAAGIEIAVTGPSLRFECDTAIAITGADFDARIDGAAAILWRSIAVKAGSILEFGTAQDCGSRAYVAIAGGFDVSEYLGSRSTFILGKFGGHAGRVLRAGDVLHIGENTNGLTNRNSRRAHSAIRQRLGNRDVVWAARRPGFLRARGYRNVFRHGVEGASQFRSDRRASDRTQAGVGSKGRRRSGPASFEYPRQRLRDRHGGLHRRHAGDSRPRRTEPRRVRVSRNDCARGVVEDRTASAGRYGPVSRFVA
jgi:urea carboxylase